MSTPSRRYRSLTASSNSTPPPNESTTTLRHTLQKLTTTLQEPAASRSEHLSTLNAIIRQIRQCLAKSPPSARARDTFRHLNGFAIILDTIRAASGYYHPTQRNHSEKFSLFQLLEDTLALLAEAFKDHYGNRRYFKKRVDGGGWAALEQAIASIGFGGSDFDTWSENKLFGILLAFAIGKEELRSLCQKIQDSSSRDVRKPISIDSDHNSQEKRDTPLIEDMNGSNQLTIINKADPIDEYELVSSIGEQIQQSLNKNDILYNPDIAPTIIGFWKALPRGRHISDAPSSFVVILILSKISSFSQSNLLALHSTGILSSLLPFAFESDLGLSNYERKAVEELCGSLMSLGMNTLNDARYLLRSKSAKAGDFLLRMTKSTQNPPHIQFDLSLNGFASIELQTLGRPFPPSASAGYTFTAWIYIDQFDPNAHTTIFGAFDSSQTCFVLIYLEKDTHNFILQTSVTSSRPSIRFKSTKFQERKWYHIAIVHRRPKAITSSKAALYVDGEFSEQVKCQYPAPPAPSNASTDSFASFTSSTSKLNPVQAFIGTPQDLSTRLGRGLILSRWSLASAHLFEDALSDDLLAVHYRLGPRYNGNFQDCLGSFQTYEASAALGMRNDLMHPGKDEKSDILAAIREKASNLVPESRILLSISPSAILGEDTQGEIDMSHFLRGLSRNAMGNLLQLTRSSGSSIAINAAIGHINDALTRTAGTAVMTGGPVVIVPQALDDAMWRLGGCTAIGLKLVAEADSREDIVRAVEIFLQSIKGSWRNSEAMERENGYAILAALLRGKLGAGLSIISANSPGGDAPTLGFEEREKLSFELLSIILGFVGYKHEVPEDSLINNPLAYRILLVDFDMWRKSAPITQKLYYRQLITFGVSSKYHHFNSKRLIRMRIVKRFLDALKGENFTVETFLGFKAAFSSLVKANINPEVLRSLSLFITYSLHKPSPSASRTPRVKYGTVSAQGLSSGNQKRPALSVIFDAKQTPTSTLSKKQLGIGILDMYTDLVCERGDMTNLKKFARTVTNKWLLHLLTEDDPEVVTLATKIIARLVVTQGSTYASRFAEKNGGYVVMRHHLKRWWDIPTLWPILFSILFHHDVADIDYERNFDLFSLLETFGSKNVASPQVLPVIISMLQQGLNSLLKSEDDPDSPLRDKSNGLDKADSLVVPPGPGRRRSMSLTKELEARQTPAPSKERLDQQAKLLHTVVRFLADLHTKSLNFRDFAISSDYVRLLLGVLYPAIVNADTVSPETELNSRDSALTFEGDDVIIRPISRLSTMPTPIVRTTTVPTQLGNDRESPVARTKPLRRGSSFILLTAKLSEFMPSPARLSGTLQSPKKMLLAQQASNALVEELLELVMAVFVDQVLVRKEFPGFGLSLKVPPGFQEHQAYFESYILRNTMSQLNNTIQLDQKMLLEPRIITNMARFTSHMSETVYEGWFLGGAEPLLDFSGGLLDYLQRPDIAKVKSVRLCSQAIQTIRSVFLRVVLLRLSEIDSAEVPEIEALEFMNKLFYWQTILLSSEVREGDFLKLVCYQLYTKLVNAREKIRLAAADLWRILLVQKPEETSVILSMSMDKQHLILGFKKLTELDNETFVQWVDGHREELDKLFFGAMSRAWEDFVNSENAKTAETGKMRLAKRKDRLRQLHADNLNEEDILFRHDLHSNLWMKNIYASEHLKHQRAMQDQQDTLNYLSSSFSKMERDLHRPCAVFDDGQLVKWKLDRTEGRNRMRMRMLPDRKSFVQDYQPKGKSSIGPPIKLDTKLAIPAANDGVTTTPTVLSAVPGNLSGFDGSRESSDAVSISEGGKGSETQSGNLPGDDDFELVDDPNDNEGEGYEDKNRKVMRSLNRGELVQHVFNISRIIGLEACEGLLIIGRDSLYLIDDVFQRSDGEIVSVWNAPSDERDPYLLMISGQKATVRRPMQGEQETRSWKWNEVLSISKRRFLFRDVAIEVFFTDGRSYLLTARSQPQRDDLHSKLCVKAPQTSSTSSLADTEDTWRLEALKVSDESPVSFGAKFGNIFNSSAWNPAMRKWAKGEMSNFHYLMLINTMAGRTFNDLTQYPVFPWVLADYTSEELDLDNSATFRDLSKPMGAQHSSRQAEFVERYKTFAEMGDQPAFHYGTHYSSAMIVTSYLIRLQPFVQSYLLLQGGNFDHADRLFYSIEKAWTSASRDNMTDVRELIPEFFYLPEFLTNSNGYNFGQRQGNGGSIDNVVLPPWAKGDPKIFIAKHREALESPYVTRNLHHWIDLIFGCKQRGEAAIDNTNVFHHLSYHGAKDLDAIEDPVERLATIGIIHNFGQTPHQVFSRPHQPCEDRRNRPKRLDMVAESLTRLPFPLFEHSDSITSLTYTGKLDRLLCSTAFRLIMPPLYDKYMDWGFADNSIRFYSANNRSLIGLFENLHQGQITCAIFADSKTLVTAGIDCVLSVWTVTVSSNSKTVDLTPKTSLFGHSQPVSIISVSKSFSTILSASTDGLVLLWDLNRLEFIRKLASGRPIECAQINNVTGDIMLCRGQKVALYTLNGDLILDQNVCSDVDDYVYSCAFYEGVGNEWLENNLLFTGHRRGVANVWKKVVRAGKWMLELVKRMDHVDAKSEGGGNNEAPITSLLPMACVVYTGDEDGKAYQWDCVQRER